MLRDCNTLVSNISVQLMNRDTGEMVRSALRTVAVVLLLYGGGRYEQSVFTFSSSLGKFEEKGICKKRFLNSFLKV